MHPFRFPLFLAALAALTLASETQAQRLVGEPVLDATASSLFGEPAPITADALTSRAACANGTAVSQGFVANATFATAAGDTAGPQGTPQELGQSLTAPCDGIFQSFAIVGQSTVAGQVFAGTLYVYDGAGTTGTALSAQPFSFTLQSVGGFFLLFTLDAFPVVEGQVLTAFIDISGANFNVQFVDPGTYEGGSIYVSTSGGPAGASPITTLDLRFTATFNAAVTAATPTLFNPTSAELDGQGYRLLAPPVSGISIADLAAQNLVQGVPGGVVAPPYAAQYPAASDNLFTGFTGTSFEGPASTAEIPLSGRGFFWYLYDRDITPDPASFGGGTSTSRELTGFTLSATGSAQTTNLTRQIATSSSGDYMLGNPFTQPFQLSGLSQSEGGGTFGTVFSVFDPAIANYRTLGPTDFVAPWQGFFASTTGATNPTFVYDVASTSPTATPPFYGRTGTLAEAGLRFRLDGETAAGPTVDVAAIVRLLPDALVGNDRHDGGKLFPPGGAYALLAPVGELDGAPRRLSVNSLPEAFSEALTVPMDLMATHGGTFTLSWENTLGAGRTALLRDLASGATVDLATQTSYTFAADAADWATRFELTLSSSTVSSESGPSALRVGTFAPNPTAGGLARLALRVDAAQTVRAVVLDALGRQVAVVFDAPVGAGAEVDLAVNTSRLAPGTYVVRIVGDTFAESRRLTVAR